MTKRERYITICPRCGSRDVSTDTSTKVYMATGLFHNKKCDNCNYIGLFPEVREEDAPKRPKKVKKL